MFHSESYLSICIYCLTLAVFSLCQHSKYVLNICYHAGFKEIKTWLCHTKVHTDYKHTHNNNNKIYNTSSSSTTSPPPSSPVSLFKYNISMYQDVSGPLIHFCRKFWVDNFWKFTSEFLAGRPHLFALLEIKYNSLY